MSDLNPYSGVSYDQAARPSSADKFEQFTPAHVAHYQQLWSRPKTLAQKFDGVRNRGRLIFRADFENRRQSIGIFNFKFMQARHD